MVCSIILSYCHRKSNTGTQLNVNTGVIYVNNSPEQNRTLLRHQSEAVGDNNRTWYSGNYREPTRRQAGRLNRKARLSECTVHYSMLICERRPRIQSCGTAVISDARLCQQVRVVMRQILEF